MYQIPNNAWIKDNAFGFALDLPAKQCVPSTSMLPTSLARPGRAL